MRLCGAMMKPAVLLLVFVFSLHAEGTRYSPPGKPALTSCRSPEKETFTCWWRPGSDGGLPTKYALYYRKENYDAVYECPDYHTAGENSCFFNKNDTSIWVNYNITVVATNALGSAFSDPVDIDVVYIVQPNPPEKLSLTVLEDKGWPFLRVSWEPPRKADTRSGWITLIYEIRIKLDGESDWETHLAGQQKMFNIFSLRSGRTYLVQVRCKPDHGFWSEWTSTSYIRFPDYFHRENSVWIPVMVFSALIVLILTWLLYMNSSSLKNFLLPPVPGPKIKGFDKQLLKSGKSDDVFGALVVSDFPLTSSSNYEDLLVEYLEVSVSEEQELMLEKSLKSESSTSDSDSGRGSCDSHNLLVDKCGEEKDSERRTDEEGRQTATEAQRHLAEEDLVCSGVPSGRVKTWPSLFFPLPQYSSPDQCSLEMVKQHCFSDSQFPTSTASSYLTHPDHGTKEVPGPAYWEGPLSTRQSHSEEIHRQLQTHSDVNISNKGREKAAAGLLSPALLRSAEYVEVQRINEKNMVLLQPVEPAAGHSEGCPLVPHERDYSKVRRVGSDNMLLLQRQVDVIDGDVDRCPCEDQGTNGVTESCDTFSTLSSTHKPAACIQSARLVEGERPRATSGYVDTATMYTMSTY